MQVAMGGRVSLPLVFCIHMRLGPIYPGVIYLVEKLESMGFFRINVNACLLTHPINNYNFLGNNLEIPYFTYTTFYTPDNQFF